MAVEASTLRKSGVLGIKCFVIVRSWDRDTATVRMQSEPIRSGLAGYGALSVSLHNPGTSELVIDDGTCLIFHFDDDRAIQAIRGARRTPEDVLTVCLGSDIYRYSLYTDLHDIVDLYVMPTELHQQALQAQVYKPVYHLPECVDPIGLGDKHDDSASLPDTGRKRVLWFGYPDSFYKSMASLMPIIQLSLEHGFIDSFSLITDEQQFNKNYPNRHQLSIIPYNTLTFSSDVQAFDYCILSHFSLDLALNTYIKSPNKAITALCAGIVPIVSSTPNYRSLLDRFSMQRFLFSSPGELGGILSRLSPDDDLRFVRETGAANLLLKERSQGRLLEQFISILVAHDADRVPLAVQTPMTYADAIFRDAPKGGALGRVRRAIKRRLR